MSDFAHRSFRTKNSYENPFSKPLSGRGHMRENVVFDLRMMRNMLDGVPDDIKQVIIKNMRTVYPHLLIDLDPRGKLWIQPIK